MLGAAMSDGAQPASEPLRRIGARMANLCYNAAQLPTVPEHIRKTMDDCRKEWDAAVAAPVQPASARELAERQDADDTMRERLDDCLPPAQPASEPDVEAMCFGLGQLSVTAAELKTIRAAQSMLRQLAAQPASEPTVLRRAFEVLTDVLRDIEGWEDKALAEAVATSRQELLTLIYSAPAQPASEPVPSDEHLRFVERWAVHHVKTQGAEACLGVIANYPPIKAITDGYAQGVIPAQPASEPSDRAMLLELMAAFDMESWQCRICGHAEDTKDCDSAIMLREYLAAPAQPAMPLPADVEDMIAQLEETAFKPPIGSERLRMQKAAAMLRTLAGDKLNNQGVKK